jgi:hypothetical protein
MKPLDEQRDKSEDKEIKELSAEDAIFRDTLSRLTLKQSISISRSLNLGQEKSAHFSLRFRVRFHS